MSSTASPPAADASVRVREIPQGESLKAFTELSWTINAADPNWVPPLRGELKTLLDRGKHPFHKHADVAYFIAERGGRPVGRVAAIVNRLYNEFHGDRVGFFGLFECVDDEAVARALLDAAARWLQGRGMDTMRGPMNLSTNEELCSPGVLVDGFDTPPKVLMGHNLPYYGRLMDAAGMEKSKDLLAYFAPTPQLPERTEKLFEKIVQREKAVIRPLEMRRLREEVEKIKEIYNSAWQLNWGFVPLTDDEIEHMVKSLKPIVDPDLCFIAEKDGEPIGFSLALPDFNQVLRKIRSGRLLPFGIFRILWERRKIHTLRHITLGFKPEYQHAGLGAAFYLRTFRTGAAKGYHEAEGSWILEDNTEMRGALEKMGVSVYKTYRVYDRALAPAS